MLARLSITYTKPCPAPCNTCDFPIQKSARDARSFRTHSGLVRQRRLKNDRWVRGSVHFHSFHQDTSCPRETHGPGDVRKDKVLSIGDTLEQEVSALVARLMP